MEAAIKHRTAAYIRAYGMCAPPALPDFTPLSPPDHAGQMAAARRPGRDVTVVEDIDDDDDPLLGLSLTWDLGEGEEDPFASLPTLDRDAQRRQVVGEGSSSVEQDEEMEPSHRRRPGALSRTRGSAPAAAAFATPTAPASRQAPGGRIPPQPSASLSALPTVLEAGLGGEEHAQGAIGDGEDGDAGVDYQLDQGEVHAVLQDVVVAKTGARCAVFQAEALVGAFCSALPGNSE
jgi:hypothetical protein